MLEYFIDVARNVSSRRDGQPDEVFELTKTDVYPEKIAKLAESFGMMIVKIEARELRLCAFLKLKMNTKEIASVTSLSVKTVEVYRSQLRQKLNVPKGTSLVKFISGI